MKEGIIIIIIRPESGIQHEMSHTTSKLVRVSTSLKALCEASSTSY